MTILDKSINTFGLENPITITIAYLEEQGKHELAEQLYENCEALSLYCPWCGSDDLDSTFHFTKDTF